MRPRAENCIVLKGNFDSYEEDKMRGLGVSEIIPSRIKFQKFGR